LLSVCSKNGLTPLDLAESKFIKKDDFEISEEVFKSDLIINLPILGSKSSTSNLLRFIKKESYLSLEYLSKKEEIMKKLLELLPECLTVGDGIMVQKSNKQTAYLGLILASFNSLDLDKVFNQIIMREDSGNIPVVGREIKELQFNLDKIC